MTTYIPFGRDCFPAYVISNGGLNRLTMPFDSVLASHSNLKKILDTDFKDFLNLKYLVKVEKKDKIATKHLLYNTDIDPEGTPYGVLKEDIFFNHHNLFDPKTYDFYIKKINNFRDTIKSNKKIVFVSSIKVDNLISSGLNNYFNRNAETSYIVCDWKQSNIDKVETYSIGGIEHVDLYSKNKFDCEIVAKMACKYISEICEGI